MQSQISADCTILSSSSAAAASTAAAAAAAAAVDVAATRALDLVLNYSELEDSAEGWQHPEAIYAELDKARCEVMNAWMNLKRAEEEQTKQSNQKPFIIVKSSDELPTEAADLSGVVVKEEDLRAAYMDMITDAFADVLEDLHNNNQVAGATSSSSLINVDVLVDCLQSGLDLMTQEDKEFFWMGHNSNSSFGGGEDDDDDDHDMMSSGGSDKKDSATNGSDPLTPHEIRRREHGFYDLHASA